LRDFLSVSELRALISPLRDVSFLRVAPFGGTVASPPNKGFWGIFEITFPRGAPLGVLASKGFSSCLLPTFSHVPSPPEGEK